MFWKKLILIGSFLDLWLSMIFTALGSLIVFLDWTRLLCFSDKTYNKTLFSFPDTPVSKATAWETPLSVHWGEPLCRGVSATSTPPNYTYFPVFKCLQRDIFFCCAVLVLSSLTLATSITARSQASLFSELDRLGAELDSEIQGLERKLSQKKQHRGRGEVLSAPSWLSVLKHRLIRQHLPAVVPPSLSPIVQPPHTASRLSPLTSYVVVQPWNDLPALHQMESLCRHLPAFKFACKNN